MVSNRIKYLYGQIAVLCLLLHISANAQSLDSLTEKTNKDIFSISGGVDVYYAFDITKPLDKSRLYTTQAYRHNEFNINWGFLEADYKASRVRATLALQTGTYVQANYTAEPNELTRLIAQANVGVKLSEALWLDMGILPSHIGYESTFSLDNEVYTRALMAENSPYFETGAKLTAEISDKIAMEFLLLNGWQIIQETNDAKSLGFGISYTPTEQLTLGYNNYFGNEAPKGMRAKRRFFQNTYVSYAFNDRFNLAGSIDYGRQDLLDRNGSWYAGMLITQYKLNRYLATAGRIEHYNDSKQIIIATHTPNGFQTSSVSLNLDFIPASNVLWRLEGRGYDSKDPVFIGEEGARRQNLLIVTSFSLKFK